MLESLIAAGVVHLKKRPVEGMEPEAKVVNVTKTGKAIIVVFAVVVLAFNMWIASIAYTCNGNSLVSGTFAFFFPVVYIIVHALFFFRCDRIVPAMTGGRRSLRSKR